MTNVASLRQDSVLDFDEAYEIIGGLSKPDKMPWYSWSTDARDCITGSILHKQDGSVCSSCYARKGFYNFPGPRNAMARRFDAVKHSEFVPAFVLVLNTLFDKETKRPPKNPKTRVGRFRWFDSGDLQDVKHLGKIVSIATGTPRIDHLLFTKEYLFLRRYAASHQTPPKNLVIRPSFPTVGGSWDAPPGYGWQATVDAPGGHDCPSMKQGHRCVGAVIDCNACWDPSIPTINFGKH
jgi:hypothetical protein